MNSASKAFGEGAASLGISSEPVTAHQVFVAIATYLNEQVIFEDLNV